MGLDREKLVRLGWKFGACFSGATSPALCERIDTVTPDGAFFIAVTHDCSAVNPSLEAEPLLEWLMATPIAEPDGRSLNGRNIRRLHLEISIDGNFVWCELTMGRRGFVGREGLDQLEPSNSHRISEENRNILKRWLANRYTSQTFPDSFNQRISRLVSSSKSPLTKLFNTEIGKACGSVYLRLDPFDSELPEDQDYEVTAVALFSEDNAAEIGRQSMEEFAGDMKERLEAARGLNPVHVFALSEEDITYADIAKLARWQLDYISLADGAEIVVADQA